jgi:hypothetical protein
MFCKLRGIHHREDVEINGKIIIERVWTAMSWLRTGTSDRLLQTRS